MENEGKILEVLSESLKRQDQILHVITEMNDRI
jgi:hypothetical protein